MRLYTLTGDKFETKRYSGCVGEIAKWGEPADILSQWDICSQARVEIRLCFEDENTVHIYHPRQLRLRGGEDGSRRSQGCVCENEMKNVE
ncbi:MAG: hypothetical protein ACLUE2_14580 [Bacteroides cellulosilyticus]